jgi:hypothetical protein
MALSATCTEAGRERRKKKGKERKKGERTGILLVIRRPRLEENLDPIQRRNRRLRHAACVRSPIPVQLSVSPLKSSEMGVTAVGPALV